MSGAFLYSERPADFPIVDPRRAFLTYWVSSGLETEVAIQSQSSVSLQYWSDLFQSRMCLWLVFCIQECKGLSAVREVCTIWDSVLSFFLSLLEGSFCWHIWIVWDFTGKGWLCSWSVYGRLTLTKFPHRWFAVTPLSSKGDRMLHEWWRWKVLGSFPKVDLFIAGQRIICPGFMCRRVQAHSFAFSSELEGYTVQKVTFVKSERGSRNVDDISGTCKINC